MALHSLLDVALHFDSFRNVDLFHQGLYHIKTRLYREVDDERLMAIPYGFMSSPTPEQPKTKVPRIDHHNLIPPHIIEDDHNTFSTRSFLIRYCEEEVELNDIVQFRFELTPELLQDDSPLCLEVELMFADLTNHGGADRFGENPDVGSADFKCVSQQVHRIHGAEQGLHEFCSIVFDEFHFCTTNLCIHSTLLDVRFRLRPPEPVPARPTRILKGDLKGDKSEEAVTSTQRSEAQSRQNAALSLTECMFGNCRGAGREQLLLATEAFYQSNLKVLAKSYAGLLAWYQEVVGKCLTESHREALEELTEPEAQLTGCGLLLPSNGSLQHWLNSNGTTPSGQSPPFKSYLTRQLSVDADENDFARHVALDMNVASCQILSLWHRVLNAMLYCGREVSSLLRRSWEQRMASQWHDFITRKDTQSSLMRPLEDRDHSEPVNRTLDVLAKTRQRHGPRPILIEDMSLASDLQPMLFEEWYSPLKSENGKARPSEIDMQLPSAPKEYRGVHLFVLVHGFQGNAFDMRLFKNNLALVHPDAIFLVSTSNEDNTDGDLNEMGIRLAQEVTNFIQDWCPGSALARLSFVGYSIGGVIVRSAIPLLQEYWDKFYTFVSLSCCHFGFLDQQSTVFNSAVWMLSKWKKCQLLDELAMNDAKDLKDTYLSKLCQRRGLEHFKWICLISSKQDNYSPSKSSRMEMDPAWEKSPSKEAFVNMVKNVWEHVKPERVMRLRAHFDLPEKNVDAMIGRVAHIRFIECQPIMRMLIHSYGFLFR